MAGSREGRVAEKAVQPLTRAADSAAKLRLPGLLLHDCVEAHIDAMEELTTDGSTFELRGHLTSGNLRGAVFAGTYDVSSRSGRLILKRA